MRPIRITGGQMLAGGSLTDADIFIADGSIADRPAADARSLDATGLLVLPGIVDLHGDAFERQLQPRPGVDFPIDLALAETERQLLANGITTAFHGVTLSWEPGLRSVETWHKLLAALDAGDWTCDMRVHLRWEAYNLDAIETAIADIAAGRVHLLAFNDHTPAIMKKLGDDATGAKYSDRGPLSLAEFRLLAERIASRATEVPAALDRIAQAARAAGLPMASHDDDSISVRDGFRERGARICEFPMAEPVGRAARDAGDAVAMGSPNVVRGGSHLGWASAARLAEAGICSVLTSDYYYPCLLRAAFILGGRGVLSLPQAWDLVSANPAAAGGLADRGQIAPGKRADLIVVDTTASAPRLVATIAQGRIAYFNPVEARRLG
jgi:alpha-D-ribose 1-methylphosphonate 5-triphosphate diphosphatase